jgi:hypothetical protein
VLSVVLVLVVEVLESVLDLRRRNGKDGTRYDGKIDGSMSRYFHNRKSLGIVFRQMQNGMFARLQDTAIESEIGHRARQKKPELDRQKLKNLHNLERHLGLLIHPYP